MVKVSGLALLSVLAAVGTASVQASSGAAPPARATVELVGCVSDDPGTSGSFTFDESGGSRYRLTGKSVRKYAGRKVLLIGGTQRERLSIRTGLWPSPNLAGQASAIDPAQASIARQPGGPASGAAGMDLPELRVISVRGIEGSCR